MQKSKIKGHAIFLDGPIGVGKTTYGRHLAAEFAGQFLDGDDYSDPDLPWYASSLSTSRNILHATLVALEVTPIVFVAYPIRCINWIFFSHRLRTRQFETVLVGLHAPLNSIASDGRACRLSKAEFKRSDEMIAQGYGSREFSDFFIQTDAGNESEVTETARAALKKKVIIPM